MKSQSLAVRSLKNQIDATLKLIGMGIKKYILQLLNLEAKLEEAMSEQLKIVQVSDPSGLREFINEARIKDICVQDTDCDEYFKVIEGDNVFEIKLVSYFHFKSDAWVEKVPKHGKQQRVERPDLIQIVETFKKELDKLPMW